MNEEEKNSLEGGMGVENAADAATNKAMSARQRAMERSRKRNPGREFADDDDDSLWNAINEDAEQDETELNDLRTRRENMTKFLKTDPRSADIFSRWHRDGSPTPALIREYGKEIVADITNPDIQAQIELDNQEYLKRLAENEELDRQAEENLKDSREQYQSLVDEGEYSKEQIDEALDSLEAKFEAWLTNKVSKEMIVDEIKAMGYDADTENARRNGRTSGRNENIAKEFDRRRRRGDGVPALEGGGGNGEAPKRNGSALDNVSRRASIWD